MLLLFGIFSLLWWLGQRTWCGNYVSSLLRKQLLLEQFVESGDGEFDINNTAFFGGTTTTVTTNNITVYDDWSDISMASAMAASLFAGYLGVDFFLLAQGNRWYHLAGLIKLFLTLYSTQGVYRHVRGQKRDEELFWRYSYGMNFSLVDKAEITSPNADKDLLMLIASFSCSPVVPVLSWRSLPARSTKFSFPAWKLSLPSSSVLLHSMITVKIACDREDVAFINVAATLRLPTPFSMMAFRLSRSLT